MRRFFSAASVSRSARLPASPSTKQAVESASAHAPSPHTTVTLTSPLSAGFPVLGSMMWW